MPAIRLAFLGAGNMAEAIARGILRGGVLSAAEMLAADPQEQRRRLFREDLGIEAASDNTKAVEAAPTVIVAVKPQQFDAALGPVAGRFGPAKLAISICAGISTRRIEQTLAPGTRVVRAMPNTPMLVGSGMTAICAGRTATNDDLATAERLLGAAGQVIRVPEDLMDAVTAVSGSGPAYFFYLTELLASAGAEVGLPADQAALLAKATFEGAARLLAGSGEDPAALRRKVTSPGGTTAAAIATFDALGMRKIVAQAVRAARDRSRQLGK